MDNYEQLQEERNNYAKQMRIAKRKNDLFNVERLNFELKFLNKRLREIHKTKYCKK